MLVKSVSSNFNLLIKNSMLGSNQIDNNVYAVSLARIHRKCRPYSLKLGSMQTSTHGIPPLLFDKMEAYGV